MTGQKSKQDKRKTYEWKDNMGGIVKTGQHRGKTTPKEI